MRGWSGRWLRQAAVVLLAIGSWPAVQHESGLAAQARECIPGDSAGHLHLALGGALESIDWHGTDLDCVGIVNDGNLRMIFRGRAGDRGPDVDVFINLGPVEPMTDPEGAEATFIFRGEAVSDLEYMGAYNPDCLNQGGDLTECGCVVDELAWQSLGEIVSDGKPIMVYAVRASAECDNVVALPLKGEGPAIVVGSFDFVSRVLQPKEP